MLFLDKEQVTAQELAEKFVIDIAKVEKAPVFEINPNRKVPDPLNRTHKTPYGKGLMAVFYAKDPKTNKTHEIRFATSVNPERVGDKIIDKYEPRKVNFKGSADLKVDIDEAIYFYLHPQHKKSPFRRADAVKPWYYDFIDNTARAEDEMKALTAEIDAMNHVNKLSATRLTILAKGMKIQGVDHKEPIIVRAELMRIAKADPITYLNKAERQATLFDGMIQDAIDKDVFHLSNVSGIRRWTWNAGPRIDEVIVDVVNITQDPTQVLFNHIKQNINEYFNDLQNVTTTLRSQQISENFLENQDMTFLDNEGGGTESNVDTRPNSEFRKQFNDSAPIKPPATAIRSATPATKPFVPEGSNDILSEEDDDIVIDDDFEGIGSEIVLPLKSKPQPTEPTKAAPVKPAVAKTAKSKNAAKAAAKVRKVVTK